nr:protein ACCELERATED CELL DEATH 6-like [Ipomoea batatas]
MDLLSYFSWNPLIGVAMEFLILKHLAFTPLENIKWAFSKHLLGWKVIGKGGKIGSRGDLPEKPKEKKDDANIEKDIGFMVETSRTNITVTSLILTMTFTIGLTVPGGYNSNVGRRQGTPLLLHRFQFQAFVMYDLMAFLLSILSIFFHIVMVAEASSTKNYEVIKKYFEWNTRTTLTAALTAVAAFCSGMSATLVPLPVLDIVASVSNFWIYLGIFWLSNTILNIHGSLGLPVTNLILPPIFSILKKLYFFVLRRRPFSYGCLFN